MITIAEMVTMIHAHYTELSMNNKQNESKCSQTRKQYVSPSFLWKCM